MYAAVCWMASYCPVIDDFAKDHLRGRLRSICPALVWKVDSRSEYEAAGGSHQPDLCGAHRAVTTP